MNLQIIEVFESIQGESSFTGLPFTFIRLAGCNLACEWCDTPNARIQPGTTINLDALIHRVEKGGMRYVCITGGEPLLQEAVHTLLSRLVHSGYVVTLETNGSIDITSVPVGVHRIIDIKCPSSGMTHKNRLENLLHLRSSDEIKFVVSDRQDYLFAKRIYETHLSQFTGPLFVSPVCNHLNPSDLANWVLSDKIPFRVQLQIHKILNIP